MANVPTNIGPYRIVQAIGHGGMGSLYLAWDEKLERHIVIKVLKEDDDELRARFSREAKSAARLKHTHIVTIFELGEYDSQPYIAMEYIEGPTLAEVIAGREQPPLPRQVELMTQLCDGLGYAHKAGVVHRDIKPANIMIHKDGDLKILDFGVARIAEAASMTQAGMMIGTLNYMSPEQVSGDPIDQRSDIFAVGTVFYEFLCRKKAFPGGISSGVLGKILHGQPEPLASLCPGLDDDIIGIVGRATEKNVADRYQNLEQMRKDLLAVLRRLELSDATLIIDVSARAQPAAQSTAAVTRRASDRDELAKRRASQVQYYLDLAERAAADHRLDSVIAACEQALLLDSENTRALELAENARATLEAQQAQQFLADAERELERGALSAASELANQAGALQSSPQQIHLRKAIDRAIEEREQARRRAEAVRDAMDRAHTAFDAGGFAEAVRFADEALSSDPAHAAAIALRARATDSLAQRARELVEQRARAAIQEARQLFAQGDHAGAIERLDGFGLAHKAVTRARADLAAEAERIADERRRQAEARAKQQRIAGVMALARDELRDERFASALERLHLLERTEGATPEISLLIQQAGEAEAAQRQAELAAREAEAQRAREAAEKQTREAAERRAREAAEKKAREAADKKAREAAEQRAREAADKKAREAAEQRAREAAEKQARDAADQRAREVAEKQAREAAEQRAREAAEKQAREAAEQRAREAAEKQAREAAEQRARAAAEEKAREAADQRRREAEEEAARQSQTLLLERESTRDREVSGETILIERQAPEPQRESRPEPVPSRKVDREPPRVTPRESESGRQPRSTSRFRMVAIAAGVLIAAGGGYLLFGPGGAIEEETPIINPGPPTPPPTPLPAPAPGPATPGPEELARATQLANTGQRLLKESKLEQALATFQEAQRIAETPIATEGLAEIDRRRREYQQRWQDGERHFKAGSHRDALASYQLAQQLDPETFAKQAGKDRLTQIRSQMSDAEKAAARAEEAERLRLAREQSIKLLNDGKELARQGRYADAEDRYESAVQADKNNGEAAGLLRGSQQYRQWKTRSQAALQANDLPAAQTGLEELRKLDSDRFRSEGLDKTLVDVMRRLTPSPPPSPPKPAPADERPAILATMQALARAVSTDTNPGKDMGLVRRVFPKAGNYFERVDSQKYEYQCAPDSISFSPGNRATVRCLQIASVTRGRAKGDDKAQFEFLLEKRDGTWQILSLKGS